MISLEGGFQVIEVQGLTQEQETEPLLNQSQQERVFTKSPLSQP